MSQGWQLASLNQSVSAHWVPLLSEALSCAVLRGGPRATIPIASRRQLGAGTSNRSSCEAASGFDLAALVVLADVMGTHLSLAAGSRAAAAGHIDSQVVRARRGPPLEGDRVVSRCFRDGG